MDDFDSFSSGMTPTLMDSSNFFESTWIFQTPMDEALQEKKSLMKKALRDEAYIPSHFPEHLLDDHEWGLFYETSNWRYVMDKC